jgi:hypothetical protein
MRKSRIFKECSRGGSRFGSPNSRLGVKPTIAAFAGSQSQGMSYPNRADQAKPFLNPLAERELRTDPDRYNELEELTFVEGPIKNSRSIVIRRQAGLIVVRLPRLNVTSQFRKAIAGKPYARPEWN